MIAEAKDDVLVLSGSLTENYWETIRTAATLLLKRHPMGIVIDCSLIDEVTEAGSKTFIEALKYIEAKNARIIVANVPPHVKEALQQVLNVRSRLPFADSMEAAKASLNLGKTDSVNLPRAADVVLVPVFGAPGEMQAIGLAVRYAQMRKGELHLAYFVEIPRSFPVGTPMPEQEARALEIFEEIERQFKKQNVPIIRHIERIREWHEALMKMVEEMSVETLVLTLPGNGCQLSETFERIMKLVRKLRCEVLLYRRTLEEPHGECPASK